VTATEPTDLDARAVALDALIRIEKDNSFANLRLGPMLTRSGLDERDRRLVSELVYGTIRQQRALDYLVDRFISADPPAQARAALRLGAYQLRYTDIPDHAAVSATVTVTPRRYAGLVNAVLRKVAKSPVNWPDEPTRLSIPDWIYQRLCADLGVDAATAAIEAQNRAPSVTVREDGYTQDASSQRVVEELAIRDGELVVDVCAAPGGKATGMAAAGAQVIALDLRAKRVGLIASNAARLGLANVYPAVADGRALPIRPGSADVVLVDAPCSGLGVLRRRADARWRISEDDVTRLGAIQRALLESAATLVKPGGRLAYSVCTLTAAETTEVAEPFTAAHPEFLAQPIGSSGEWMPWGSGGVLLPQDTDSDGMALFVWQRSGDNTASAMSSPDR
jgi:16S rRNA (cytosine967-C5)-methyltransferase